MTSSLANFITLLRKDFIEYCNEKLQDMGLTQGLLYFILYIGKHPGCSPKELANALHFDVGHSARSLTKLQRSGFIEQNVNPEDRRARVLILTEKGEEAFRISHELFSQWDSMKMANLNENEQKELIGALAKLVNQKGDSHCI